MAQGIFFQTNGLHPPARNGVTFVGKLLGPNYKMFGSYMGHNIPSMAGVAPFSALQAPGHPPEKAVSGILVIFES